MSRDFPKRLRGNGYHDALRSDDRAGQVSLQGYFTRHIDARQKALVAACLPYFVQPPRNMAPERNVMPAVTEQAR